MRWERLFDDIEAQIEAQGQWEAWSEVADRTRSEQAQVWLSDRLRARLGHQTSAVLTDGSRVTGQCVDAAVDWFMLDGMGGQVLVPVAAVAAIEHSSRSAAPEAGAVLRRLGLGSALRVLARNRVQVTIRAAAVSASGTISFVGHDFVDVALHPADVAPRARDVHRVSSVAFAHILSVQTRR